MQQLLDFRRTIGRQPRTTWALEASPSNRSTSAGRRGLGGRAAKRRPGESTTPGVGLPGHRLRATRRGARPGPAHQLGRTRARGGDRRGAGRALIALQGGFMVVLLGGGVAYPAAAVVIAVQLGGWVWTALGGSGHIARGRRMITLRVKGWSATLSASVGASPCRGSRRRRRPSISGHDHPGCSSRRDRSSSSDRGPPNAFRRFRRRCPGSFRHG